MSLLPIGVEASDYVDNSKGIEVAFIEQGRGYFSQSEKSVTLLGQSQLAIGQEVVEKRTENSKTFYKGKDKSGCEEYTVSYSVGSIHYKDNYANPYEDWKDIDLTIVDGKVTKAPFELTIVGNSVLIRDKKTGDTTDLVLVDTPDSKFKLNKNIVVGRDGFKVDLPHLSDIYVEHSKSNGSISVFETYEVVEKGEVVKKTDKYDSNTKALTKKVNSTIDVKVGASTDDAWVDVDTTTIYTTAIGNAFGNVGHVAHDGMRFTGITIIGNSTINSAIIRYTAYDAYATPNIKTKISAEQNNNAATFSTYANFIGRAKTTAQVDWDFSTIWALNSTYDTGDFKTVINELVSDYSGLSSANIVIFVSDDGSDLGSYRSGYSWDSATTKCPELLIDYTIPPTPIVTTIAASLVEETTATTGGNITASTANVTTWGVQYGITGSYGSWSNTSSNPGVPYLFSKNLSSLTEGQFYYFRAFAESALGAGYGAQLTFLTKPLAPTGLTATALNTTAVTLTWTVGTGSDYTYIRHRTGSCPATIADGTLSGNVSAPTVSLIVSNLTPLQTYYFSAWGHSTGGTTYQFSDTYDCGSQYVPGLPTVITNAPTGYGNDWVNVSGNQTAGYPVSTLFGFQYGPTIAYGSWSNTTVTVSGGLFSATISGLTPSSSYHYRAFAQNPYGLGYGADMTFSTAGTAILYESHQYGCNTTWSQTYETDSTSIYSNWTTGTMTYTAVPIFGNNWTAQTFTTTSAHSTHQIVLWMSRTSTAAAGYVYVSIREATTDNVTSPDLGIGLYAIGYVSTNGGPCEVSLENEIQLDASKKYAIVVRAPSADATNYVSIWGSAAATSIYATGNAIRSITGGASWVTQDYDVYFSIIGRPQPIYGNIEAAQSFTVGITPHTAYKVRLILGRVGQPGNVYVSIRNYTGGVISNADLATVALNGNAITLDKAMYDCVLAPEKSLEANKQYAIVVTAPSGDRYNYVLICADSGAGYADGTALLSANSGISWTVQAYDYNFEVWGNACLNVLNAKVFRNYLVTGDWLIVSETLNVSPPYYDANQDPSTLFVLSFMGLTGTTYASTPCELWEKGPIAIYLNPTQASALTWGGNYKVRLSNIAGTIYSEYGLLSTDWSSSSLVYLDNWVRLVAKDMESYQTAKTGTTVNYLTYVADKGNVLNQDGGAIFNQACPRLSYVRPDLFQVASNTPDIPTSTTTYTGVDYHIILGSYLSGLIDQGAGAMGIGDTKAAGGMMIVAIYAIIAFGTVTKGFAWAGMIAAFPIILLGMYYGLLDMGMIVVILVILAFLFVREFFFKGG